MPASFIVVESIAADKTVGAADFEEVDIFADRLPEFFTADCPAQRHGGEELETVFGGQTLRSVVAEIEFREITLIEVICHTTRKSLITLRKRFLRAIIAHHVHQQS